MHPMAFVELSSVCRMRQVGPKICINHKKPTKIFIVINLVPISEAVAFHIELKQLPKAEQLPIIPKVK